MNDCCDDTAAEFARPIIQPLLEDAPQPVTVTTGAASGTSNPNHSTNSNGIASSTVIGLGAGLGLAFLIALAVISWLLLAARKRNSRDMAESSNSQAYSKASGYGGSEVRAVEQNTNIAEASGESTRFEVPS